jgi:outer membrane protein W
MGAGSPVLAVDSEAGGPHDGKGFVLGLGMGWGNAGAEVTLVEKVDRENGALGNVGFGWEVSEHVVLGLDFDVWSQLFRDTRWVINLSSVALTYFPAREGVYLAAYAGVGTARLEIQAAGTPTIRNDRAGVGFAVAGGYDWRIHEEVTLGPSVKWAYMDLGGDVTKSADYLSVTVQLTWYKP